MSADRTGLAPLEDVRGKTAFITGGASGMGWGMAKAFGEAGMNVVIADVRREPLDEALKGFLDAGLKVHAIQLDVTDRDQWAAAADEAERVFGNIHVLVNNAGVGVVGPLQKATFKDWDFAMAVNLGGVINGVMTLLPRMLAHGEAGQVVVTSSTGGFSAVGGAGIYCTAKFAVAGLMESLATDLQGTAIGASVFFPGPVATSLGKTTGEVRPEALRNDGPPPPPRTTEDGKPMPGTETFMSTEEVGRRVLRGILRRDLFIMTHPEFRDGLVARNDALVRAIPEEEPNTARHDVIRHYGTLVYNAIYDTQAPLTTPL